MFANIPETNGREVFIREQLVQGDVSEHKLTSQVRRSINSTTTRITLDDNVCLLLRAFLLLRRLLSSL